MVGFTWTTATANNDPALVVLTNSLIAVLDDHNVRFDNTVPQPGVWEVLLHLSGTISRHSWRTKKGVILTSGDGVRRRCHPLLAAYVGDYPEQVLVTGVKYGWCPKGTLDKDFFGTENLCELRDIDKAVAALKKRDTHPDDATGYVNACKAADVKPILAFWRDYPMVSTLIVVLWNVNRHNCNSRQYAWPINHGLG